MPVDPDCHKDGVVCHFYKVHAKLWPKGRVAFNSTWRELSRGPPDGCTIQNQPIVPDISLHSETIATWHSIHGHTARFLKLFWTLCSRHHGLCGVSKSSELTLE